MVEPKLWTSPKKELCIAQSPMIKLKKIFRRKIFVLKWIYVKFQRVDCVCLIFFLLDDSAFSTVSYLKNFKSLIKFIYDPENFANWLKNKQENISSISVFSSSSDVFQPLLIGYSIKSFGQYLQNMRHDVQKDVTVLSSSTKEKDLEKSFSKPVNSEMVLVKDGNSAANTANIGHSIKISNFFETPTRKSLEKVEKVEKDEVMEYVKRRKQQATYNSFKKYLNGQNSEDSAGQSTNIDSGSRMETLSNTITTPSKTGSIARRRIRKSNMENSSSVSSLNFETARLSNVKRAVINLVDSPYQNPPTSDLNQKESKEKSKNPSTLSDSRIMQSIDLSTPQSSLNYLNNVKILSMEKEIKYSTPIVTKKLVWDDNKKNFPSETSGTYDRQKLIEEKRYKIEALSVNRK